MLAGAGALGQVLLGPAGLQVARAAPLGGVTAQAEERWTLGTVSPDTSGTIRLMSWEDEGEMRKFILHYERFFRKYYPNLKPQFDWGIPWEEYWTKLQTSIAAGASPDIAWMHDTRGPTFASRGLLLPLDDYLSSCRLRSGRTSSTKTQVEAFRYQGKQYAIPYDWAPGGFYVNLDLLQEAGVDVPTEDWTFDDLLEAGKKITRKTGNRQNDRWGFNLPTSHSGSYWIVRCFGGETVAGDPPTSHFDNPNTLKAYQYRYDAMWTHQVMPTPDTLKELGLSAEFVFVSGQVGIHYALNDSAFRMAEAVGNKFRWTVAPTPKGPAGRFQFVGGSAHAIPKGSHYPEIAYEAIRYVLTNPDNLPTTGVMGSMFVARTDFWEYGLPTKESGVDPEAFKKAFYDLGSRDGVIPLYHPKYQEWEATVYIKNMDRLWVNEEQDVAKVLAQVHAETQQLLQRS